MVRIKLTSSTKILLITLYRLQFIPPSVFLEEFPVFLEVLSVMKEDWVMAGDINFHLETDEYNVSLLKDIFVTFDLTQYVSSPTHNLGHTIDFILARYDTPLVRNVETNNVQLSDHFMITFDLEAEVEQQEVRTITFRKFHDTEQFMQDVKAKYESDSLTRPTMGEAVVAYNSAVTELVDKHYQPKTKQIKVVPHAPWFDSDYCNLRKQRRKAEKKYKKTKMAVDKEAFVALRKQTTNLASVKQRDYYIKKMEECNGQKALFDCVNNLIDSNKESVLPEHTSTVELANNFATYFKEKIINIRKTFPAKHHHTKETNASFDGVPLLNFEPATEDEVRANTCLEIWY